MTSSEEQFDELFQHVERALGSPARTEVPRFMKLAFADLSRRVFPFRIPSLYIKLMESFPFSALRNDVVLDWYLDEVPDVVRMGIHDETPDQLLPVGCSEQNLCFLDLGDADKGMLWSRYIVDGDYRSIVPIEELLHWTGRWEESTRPVETVIPRDRKDWPSKWTANLPENRFAVPRIKTGDAKTHSAGTLVEFVGRFEVDEHENWFVDDGSGPVRIVGEDSSSAAITTWRRYTPGHIYSGEEGVTTYPFVPPPYRSYEFFGFIEDDPHFGKHVLLGTDVCALRNGRWSRRNRGTPVEIEQRIPRHVDYDICSFLPSDQEAFRRLALSDQRSGPRDPSELDDVFETFIRKRDAEVLVAEVDGVIVGTVVSLPGVDGLDEPAWLSAPGRDDIAQALLSSVRDNRSWARVGRLGP